MNGKTIILFGNLSERMEWIVLGRNTDSSIFS